MAHLFTAYSNQTDSRYGFPHDAAPPSQAILPMFPLPLLLFKLPGSYGDLEHTKCPLTLPGGGGGSWETSFLSDTEFRMASACERSLVKYDWWLPGISILILFLSPFLVYMNSNENDKKKRHKLPRMFYTRWPNRYSVFYVLHVNELWKIWSIFM